MALDLVRAAGACLRFVELCGPRLAPPMQTVVNTVVDRLGRRPARDGECDAEEVAATNRRAVVEALMALGAEIVADAPRGSRRAAASLARALTDGTAAAELRGAYDAGDHTGGLPSATDAVRRMGIDAERLLDGVIRHEAGRHHGLVWHQVNRLADSFPGYGPDDLFSFGWRGLCIALNNYDPERVAFSTYACTRIAGNIRDGVRSESPIPKRLNTWYRKVNSTVDDLTYTLGRPPSDTEIASAVAADRLARELGRPATLAELADALEAERRQLAILPRLSVPAPLEEAPVEAAAEDPADDAVRGLLREEVRTALAELPHDERSVIESLELDGRSIDDTARLLRISTRQVRTLRQRGRVRLAERLAGWSEAQLART